MCLEGKSPAAISLSLSLFSKLKLKRGGVNLLMYGTEHVF
jgi:hypothetical protein